MLRRHHHNGTGYPVPLTEGLGAILMASGLCTQKHTVQKIAAFQDFIYCLTYVTRFFPISKEWITCNRWAIKV